MIASTKVKRTNTSYRARPILEALTRFIAFVCGIEKSNFIVWGLFYAVFLIAERLGFEKVLKKMPVALQHIYSLFVIKFSRKSNPNIFPMPIAISEYPLKSK